MAHPDERWQMKNLALDPHGQSFAVGASEKGPKRDQGVPAGVSLSLYNQDLAPTSQKGRTWGSYSLFTLWA